MIKMLPVKDESERLSIVGEDAEACAFAVYDGDKTVATCVYKFDDILKISKITAENDYYCDLLVRAVFNAATLKGIEHAEFSDEAKNACKNVVDGDKFIEHELDEFFTECKNCR